MNWGVLLGALAKLAELVVGVFRDRALVQSGKTAEVATVQTETLHEVQAANDARAAVERDVVLHPDSLRESDDGFERPN